MRQVLVKPDDWDQLREKLVLSWVPYERPLHYDTTPEAKQLKVLVSEIDPLILPWSHYYDQTKRRMQFSVRNRVKRLEADYRKEVNRLYDQAEKLAFWVRLQS